MQLDKNYVTFKYIHIHIYIQKKMLSIAQKWDFMIGMTLILEENKTRKTKNF